MSSELRDLTQGHLGSELIVSIFVGNQACMEFLQEISDGTPSFVYELYKVHGANGKCIQTFAKYLDARLQEHLENS